MGLGSLARVVRVTVPMPIFLDDRRAGSETTMEACGADSVLVISTTVPDQAVTLRSVYVGAGGRTGGHAVHVTHTPQGRRIRHRVLVDVPVTHARERCLSDHARCVQSTLARQSGAVVAVQISDELAALAATVYPPPP